MVAPQYKLRIGINGNDSLTKLQHYSQGQCPTNSKGFLGHQGLCYSQILTHSLHYQVFMYLNIRGICRFRYR